MIDRTPPPGVDALLLRAPLRCLCDIVDVAADNAASALSRMFLTERFVVTASDYFEPRAAAQRYRERLDLPGVAVHIGVEGPWMRKFPGIFLAVMARSQADLLLSRLAVVGGGDDAREPWSAVRVSAWAELGNVVGCSFLGTVSERVRVPMLPTPPEVCHGSLGALIADAASRLVEAHAIACHFSNTAQDLTGEFVYVVDRTCFTTLVRAELS